jgi:hypothetical protein
MAVPMALHFWIMRDFVPKIADGIRLSWRTPFRQAALQGIWRDRTTYATELTLY